MNPTSYPLSWPEGRPRTPSTRRTNSPFKVDRTSITSDLARQRLTDELRRLGATSVILSTNLKPRGAYTIEGADARWDPGAAVYFKLGGKDVVLASDRYNNVAGNLAALAAHIEATRAIERYGVGTLEQLFRGFTALPPAQSVDDWRLVLGVPRDLAEAESRYRQFARIHHPDAGGSPAKMAELNAAIALARKHFGG